MRVSVSSSALQVQEPCSICWRNEITIDFYHFYRLRAGVADEQALAFPPFKLLKIEIDVSHCGFCSSLLCFRTA